MRYLLTASVAFALFMAAPGAVRAADQVICGRVQSHTPATATAAGSVTLVSNSPVTVVIPAGEGAQFGLGWNCVTAQARDGQWIFTGFVGPQDARFIPEAAAVICGTLAPNSGSSAAHPGPAYVELRDAQGLQAIIDASGTARISMHESVRPPMGTYVCVRVVAGSAFSEFVAPNDRGYIPQRAGTSSVTTRPARLPSTSTLP